MKRANMTKYSVKEVVLAEIRQAQQLAEEARRQYWSEED